MSGFDSTIDNTYGAGLVATITTASATVTDLWVPRWAQAVQIYTSVLAKYCLSTAKVGPSATITNQVQAINTRNVTAGTFTLLGPFTGVATSALQWNESAANIKTALAALADFDTADITAGGGILPTEVTLQFTGSYAGVTLPLLKIGTNSLTATSDPSIVITEKTALVNPYAWIEAGTQQVIPTKSEIGNQYLHLVNDSGAGTARVTFLRG